MSDYTGPCSSCGAPIRSMGTKSDLPPQFDPPLTRADAKFLLDLSGSLSDSGPYAGETCARLERIATAIEWVQGYVKRRPPST